MLHLLVGSGTIDILTDVDGFSREMPAQFTRNLFREVACWVSPKDVDSESDPAFLCNLFVTNAGDESSL